LDDFYLNLVDWGSSNVLAVALGQSVYLWNANDGTIDHLMETESESDGITSVNWVKDGSHLAIGTNECDVQIWDVEKSAKVRSMGGHSARVSALSWNQHILTSGSRDASIVHHDVRARDHAVATLYGHNQEVCGLKWSPDGSQLASGGNDNLVNIWDAANTKPRFTFNQHISAIKAMDWCPWQTDLLATGGGTADRCIKFWNTTTGALLNSVDTKSQVSSIIWSKKVQRANFLAWLFSESIDYLGIPHDVQSH